MRVGHNQIRRNRKFLKPIEIETASPIKQPAQPPQLEKRKPSIRFSDTNSEEDSDEEEKEAARFKMSTQRGTPGSSEPDLFKMQTKRRVVNSSSEEENEKENETDLSKMQTKRRVDKNSSEQERQVKSPPVARKQPTRRPMKPHLTWPNCQPLGKRKKQPSMAAKPSRPQTQPSTAARPPMAPKPPTAAKSTTTPTSNWSPTPNPRWNQPPRPSINQPPSSNSKCWRNDAVQPPSTTQPDQPNSRPKRNVPTVNYRQTRTYTNKERKAARQYAQAYYRDIQRKEQEAKSLPQNTN